MFVFSSVWWKMVQVMEPVAQDYKRHRIFQAMYHVSSK
jgi:hypothetical protein